MTLSNRNDEDYWFDKKAADAAVRWYKENVVHTKGPKRLIGTPFILEPWQAEIERAIAGWKWKHTCKDEKKHAQDRDCKYGRRKTDVVFVEIPRGNGKSMWAAARAVRHLDSGEPSPLVVGAATDTKSANVVFDYAAHIVWANPRLNKKLDVLVAGRTIKRRDQTGKYMVISAEAARAHGLHPTLIIFDELHTQPNRELYDVLSTSQGTIDDPLMIMFTTAGFDTKSICWEVHEKALNVLADPSLDPAFLPVIYAASEKDDITDPKVWRKANPNLGVSIREDFLAKEVARAGLSPSYLNTVLRLYFDIWTAAESAALPLGLWEKQGGIVVEHLLKGRICFGGLDLASVTDLAAFVLIFPPIGNETQWQVVCRFWLPEGAIDKRTHIDGVPYRRWIDEGWIQTTPGNAIGMAFIREEILKLNKLFFIQEIGFDRWGAEQIRQDLENEGITMVVIGQGFQSMNAPTKEWLRMTFAELFNHGGNAVLAWCVKNLMLKTDAAANLKPDKESSKEKIDGIVALIMAVDRESRNRGQGPMISWIA